VLQASPPEGGCAVRIVNSLLYGGSFLCFLLSFTAGDSAAAAVGSIPFFLLLAGGIHELGHCVGCLLTGSAIREVRLPLFRYAAGKVTLSSVISPLSYCVFQKGRDAWLVYLLGPLFSLILWALVFLAYRLHPSWTLGLGCILAFVIAAGNLLPFGRNDMAMILREILYRNEKRT